MGKNPRLRAAFDQKLAILRLREHAAQVMDRGASKSTATEDQISWPCRLPISNETTFLS